MSSIKRFRKIRKVKKIPPREELLTEETRCDYHNPDTGERCNNFRKKGNRFCDTHASEYIPTGRTPLNFNLLAWIKENKLMKNGEPFSLDDYPFLVPIYKDEHPDIKIMKASQVGITEYGVLKNLVACAVNRGFSGIYTMPAKPDASRLSKQRISTIISENRELFVKFKEYKDKKGNVTRKTEEEHYDSVLEKQIIDSFLHLQGTWMDKQAISTPADMLTHDEINFCKGDVLGKFRSRIGNSKKKWKTTYSTPTWPEVGIHKEFLKTDQNHWMYKCEHCGHIFKLCCSYPDVIQFNEETKEHYFGCPKCFKEISRREGWYQPDFPKAKGRGYHISRLCSPRVTAEDIIEARDDYKLERDFWNFELGLPYAGSEDKINDSDLNGCVDGRFTLMLRDTHTVMGIDQGGSDLWIVVLKPRLDGKFQLIYVDHLVGKNSWKEVSVLLGQLGVVRCVSDGLPNTFKAKELQDSWPKGKIYLCYYEDRNKAKEPIAWNPSKGIVTAHRSYTLDDMCNKVRDKKFIFPDSEKLVPLFKHVKALIRQKNEDSETGEISYEYKKVKRDHLAHALNYALIAANKLNLKPFSISTLTKGRSVASGRYDDIVVNFFAKQLYFQKLTKEDLVHYRCERREGRFVEEMGFDEVKTMLLFDAEMKYTVGKILSSIDELQVIYDRVALVGAEIEERETDG